MGHSERYAAIGRHAGRLAQPVADTLAESQAEVEEEALCETVRDAQALVDTLSDLRKQCSTRCLPL